jgi:hypothetical protein
MDSNQEGNIIMQASMEPSTGLNFDMHSDIQRARELSLDELDKVNGGSDLGEILQEFGDAAYAAGLELGRSIRRLFN